MAMQIAVVPVTPYQQNCSIVWCSDTMAGAVVDPGGELDRIVKTATDKGVVIEKILITHAHGDHAGGTADLAEKLSLPIIGPHPDDQFLIDSLPEQGQYIGNPNAKSFEPSQWLDDGDEVSLGNLTFKVVHCPGHTPGHVVFVEMDAKFAIVGDVIFQGSIGRTDFPRGNHSDLIHSIRKKLFVLGDDIQFLPGHGPLSTFGDERQRNPFVSDAAVGEA